MVVLNRTLKIAEG